MNSENGNKEIQNRENESSQSTIKGNKLYDSLIGECVRRSPRAPARVKTNFNDIFCKESGAKKHATESMTQNCDESELSTESDSFPGPIDTADGRRVDAHCWLCHKVKPNQEPEDLSYCVKCVRVFHFECLGTTQRFNDEGLCPECRITSLDGTKLHDSLTSESLEKLLTSALKTMMKNAEPLKTFSYSEKQNQDLISPVDLLELVKNIQHQHYKSTAAFLSDVKWILHNMMILPGVNRTLITMARKFVAECRTEMLDIEACPDCYEHMHSLKENWFSELCNVNHTLVWVKIKGFPYWPAKVLKVIDGVADVRFFGTYEKALVKVPGDNCFWLSKESPNRKAPQHSLFKVALEELEIYVKNVQKRYGPIQYYSLETKYDPAAENICIKQVNRKRERSNSGPQSKSKKQKTAPVPDKDDSVESNNENVAKVNSGPQMLNGSKEATSVVSAVKDAMKPPERHSPVKKGTVFCSLKDSICNESSKSEKTAKSSGVRKIATRHPRLPVESPITAEKHSGSNLSLPSPKRVSSVSSTKQSDKSGGDTVPRTKPKRSTKRSGRLNPESAIPGSSDHSNNELADKSHSVPEVNGCNKAVEHPPVNSETDCQEVTPSEEISDNNVIQCVPEQGGNNCSLVSSDGNMSFNANAEEPAFTPNNGIINPESHSVPKVNSCNKAVELPPANSETYRQDVAISEEMCNNNEISSVPEQVGVNCSVVSHGGNVPPFNTNTEEPGFASNSEVSNPANMLEFYVEELDNQNDFSYEPVTAPTYEYSSENVESVHVQRPQPFSVEVTSNENMEPEIVPHQPCVYCVVDPVPENPQENRYICTVPLPEELNVEKYQERVNTTIRATVEEIWHDYINSRNVQNLIFRLQQDKEDMELKYKKQAEDVAENTNLIISAMVKEHAEALEALRRKYEQEKEEAIKEMQKKILCRHCGKEAMFYCCGDDSCCDHPCQKAHWLVEQIAASSSTQVNSDGEPQSPDSSVNSNGEAPQSPGTWKTQNKEQSRVNHNGIVTAQQQVQLPHCTHSPSRQTPSVTLNSAPNVPASSVTPSRTHSGVMSNKCQIPPYSQHTTSSHHFPRPPQLVPCPSLVARPPEANRSLSVPPDSSSII